MRGDERLDEVIDAALRSYAEPEEIPETRVGVARVLDRARAEEAVRKRVWLWGWAVAAASLVVILVALGSMGAKQVPEIAWTPNAPDVSGGEKPIPRRLKPGSSRIHGTAAAMPLQSGSLISGRAKRVASARVVEERPLPKLDVFPTPTPLSPQEQALAAFAQHGPPAVQRAVLEDQQHWDDPIIVADLREQSVAAGNPQDQ